MLTKIDYALLEQRQSVNNDRSDQRDWNYQYRSAIIPEISKSADPASSPRDAATYSISCPASSVFSVGIDKSTSFDCDETTAKKVIVCAGMLDGLKQQISMIAMSLRYPPYSRAINVGY